MSFCFVFSRTISNSNQSLRPLALVHDGVNAESLLGDIVQDGRNQETVPLCSTSLPKPVQFVNSSLLDVWSDDIHYVFDLG